MEREEARQLLVVHRSELRDKASEAKAAGDMATWLSWLAICDAIDVATSDLEDLIAADSEA